MQILQKFIFGVPVNSDVMFSNNRSSYSKTIEKQQRKLVMKATFVRPILEDGESVILISKGRSLYSFLDILLFGWLFFWLKCSMIIFTDRRILQVPTNLKSTYLNSIANIYYSGCNTITLNSNTLVFECPSCLHTDRYFKINHREKKKLSAILQKDINFGGDVNKGSKKVHLCPRCKTGLSKGTTTCTKCHLRFKNKTTAMILSLLIPGGGYFYTRRIVAGLLNAIIEIALFSGLFIPYIAANAGYELMIEPLYAVGLFLTAFTFWKIASVYHPLRILDHHITEPKYVNTME